jgi:hypothetical protein
METKFKLRLSIRAPKRAHAPISGHDNDKLNEIPPRRPGGFSFAVHFGLIRRWQAPSASMPRPSSNCFSPPTCGGGAGQRLLPMGRHDRPPRAATDGRIAETTLMLGHNFQAPLASRLARLIPARSAWSEEEVA